jgi:hypothetical protein
MFKGGYIKRKKWCFCVVTVYFSCLVIQLPKRSTIYCKSESIEWFKEDPAFPRSYDSAPHPPPPPLSSVIKLDQQYTGRPSKRDNLLTEEGKGGGRGAKSYDWKKAWSHMNHSMLAGAIERYLNIFSIIRGFLKMYQPIERLWQGHLYPLGEHAGDKH